MKDRESHYDPRLQSGGQSLAENAANSGPWLCSVLSGGPARSGILCRVTSVLKLDTVLMKKHQDESAKLKDTAQRGAGGGVLPVLLPFGCHLQAFPYKSQGRVRHCDSGALA